MIHLDKTIASLAHKKLQRLKFIRNTLNAPYTACFLHEHALKRAQPLRNIFHERPYFM